MNPIRLILFFVLFTGLTIQAQNFEGTDFRFAFINNLDSAYNGPPEYFITGEAVGGDAEISVTFGAPSDPNYFTEQISVPAGETYSLTYTNEFLYQRAYGVVQHKSFHIEATQTITVYATYYRLYYSEGSAVMPTDQMSGDYTVVAMNYTGSSLDIPQPSLATIIGLEDGTEVHYIPSATLTPNAPAGVEQTVMLNAGETFTLASMADLTNTRIFTTDDVPIVVFSGHKHTYVECGADNYLYEQLLPKDLWGNHYALIPTGNEGQDLLRIIASEDNTDIFIGCSFLTTLNTGEFYEATLDEPGIYNSTAPILPVCYTLGIACNGFDTGDPSMRIPIPLDRGNNSVKIRSAYDFEGIVGIVEEFYFVHLVTTAADSSSVLIDGTPVTNWTPFEGLSELVFATPLVTPSPSVVSISSSSPFWGEYIGLGDFDAIAMSIGSDTTMSFPPLQPIFFSLGPDFGLCPNESAILETDIGVEGIWQDGTESATYLADSPGMYTIFVPNPCGTSSDTVVIFPFDVPNIQLEPFYETCAGDSVLLDPNLSSSDTVNWSTGSDSPQIYVSAPDWYSITVTNADGCFAKDSTLLEVEPLPEIEITGPEYICEGELVSLIAVTNADSTLWSNGEISTVVTVSEGGEYSVIAKSDFGCESQAFFELDQRQLPFIIANDSVFCEGSELVYIPMSNGESVFWPGFSTSDTLFVSTPGVYQVVAENECGEVSSSVIFESEDCSCELEVPNIFSPNGDNKNDLFLVRFACQQNNFFELTILDRWGVEVYQTSNPEEGWNGGMRNDLSSTVSDGVYYVIINYDIVNLSGEYLQKTETTSLTLVR